jgi:beta-alanine degradation protein BauB
MQNGIPAADLLISASLAGATDHLMESAQPTLQIDNETVRVTQWYFAPGAATGFHRHEYEYVVVPMTTGKLLLDEPQGKRHAELVAGVSYTRPAGVEHDVINANDFPFVFVEIEIKR